MSAEQVESIRNRCDRSFRGEYGAFISPESRLCEAQHACELLLCYISQQSAELEDLKHLLQRVRSAAISGMNAAKEISRHELATAKRLRAESTPEVVDSERSANALLTEENERLRQQVSDLQTEISEMRIEHRDAMREAHADGRRAERGDDYGCY